MKRACTALGALPFFGFVLSVGGNLAADDSIVVKGAVKEVTAGETGGRVLAEILVDVDGKGKHVFLLHKGTKVSLANKKPGQWTDLKTGQRVSISFSGIVAPSRPPQVGADEIAIEVQSKSKQDR